MKEENWNRKLKVGIQGLGALGGITEPPCKNCRHFGARIERERWGFYPQFCSAENMFKDFSCWKEKEQEG